MGYVKKYIVSTIKGLTKKEAENQISYFEKFKVYKFNPKDVNK